MNWKTVSFWFTTQITVAILELCRKCSPFKNDCCTACMWIRTCMQLPWQKVGVTRHAPKWKSTRVRWNLTNKLKSLLLAESVLPFLARGDGSPFCAVHRLLWFVAVSCF